MSAEALVRVFFALWPGDAAKQALAETAAKLREQCGGRATSAAKAHITLFFVGSIARTRLPALEALAASVESRGFELVLDRIGYWRHNRIVWAGAHAVPDPLSMLAAELTRRLATEGVVGEPRPYVPHVTLLRNAERAPRTRTMPPLEWAVREFALVESAPAGAGVQYNVMKRWPLASRIIRT